MTEGDKLRPWTTGITSNRPPPNDCKCTWSIHEKSSPKWRLKFVSALCVHHGRLAGR